MTAPVLGPIHPSSILGIRDRLLTTFDRAFGLRYRDSYDLPPYIRVAGAWTPNPGLVNVIYVSYEAPLAEVRVATISVDPSRPDFGRPEGGYTVGRATEPRGFSATSARVGSGMAAIDAIFAYYADDQIFVASVEGATGLHRDARAVARSETTPIASVSGGPGGVRRRTVARVAPAVCHGDPSRSTSKVLLAYAEYRQNFDLTTPVFGIQVGFLSRDSHGVWQFERTDFLPSPNYCGEEFNVGIAYDSTLDEWALIWYCGNNDVFGARVAATGRFLRDRPNLIHSYVDTSSHSPVALSYNPRLQYFLLQAEHDLNFVRSMPDGTIQCVGVDGGIGDAINCRAPVRPFSPAGDLPATRLNLGYGPWATTVDYSPGHTFRQASSSSKVGCNSDADCDDGTLCAGELAGCVRSDGSVGSTQSIQFGSPVLGPDADSGFGITVTMTRERPSVSPEFRAPHTYIHVPGSSLVVLVLVGASSDTRVGELRYTFLDDVGYPLPL